MSVAQYVTGHQHVGLPTDDMAATLKFYETLGFEIILDTKNNDDRVVFLQLQNIVIETYDAHGAAGKRGAIDHLALNVTDVEKALEEIRKTEYPVIEGPNNLPFFENGVRYFSIMGPNAEVVEFNQKL